MISEEFETAQKNNLGAYTHRCNFLEIEPVRVNDVFDISPFIEPSQPPRERDLTKDVEHEELDPLEEVQLDIFVNKQLVQSDKKVLQSRRHEGLEVEEVSDRVQISNRASHLAMHILIASGEDIWNLAALHSGHDGVIKFRL